MRNINSSDTPRYSSRHTPSAVSVLPDIAGFLVNSHESVVFANQRLISSLGLVNKMTNVHHAQQPDKIVVFLSR
jgi:hypothetical protein